MFQSGVLSAHESGEATFKFDGITHKVVRQDGAADIEIGPQTVVWRFDDAKLVEMLDLMVPMVNEDGPGHQYVDDLKSPVEVLVLSVDEYKGPLSYGEFPQLYPVSAFPESQRPTASGDEARANDEAPQAEPTPPPIPTAQGGTERT